jgi:hypothetical protein
LQDSRESPCPGVEFAELVEIRCPRVRSNGNDGINSARRSPLPNYSTIQASTSQLSLFD